MRLNSFSNRLAASAILSPASQPAKKPPSKPETLQNLCEELEEAIRILKGDDQGIHAIIEDIKERATLESNPGSHYALLLWRKYKQNVDDTYRKGILDDDPDVDYHRTTDDFFLRLTSGVRALGLEEAKLGEGSSITRVRILTAAVSCLALVILAACKKLRYSELMAADFFKDQNECQDLREDIQGSFVVAFYHAIMVWGGLCLVQSMCLILYSLLPVDQDTGHKLIPGLRYVGLAELDERQVSARLQYHGEAIELALDSLVLVAGVLCATFASISMDSPQKFFFVHEGIVQYYTLTTFYVTFSETTECMQGRNPADFVKGALTLVYLALFFLSLSFRTSYSAWRKVQNTRQKALSEGYVSQEEVGEATSPFLSPSRRRDSTSGVAGSRNDSENNYSHISFMAHDTGVFSDDEDAGLAMGPLGRPRNSPYSRCLGAEQDTPIAGLKASTLATSINEGTEGEEQYFESDSEIDAVLNSAQSEASFHGNPGDEADFV